MVRAGRRLAAGRSRRGAEDGSSADEAKQPLGMKAQLPVTVGYRAGDERPNEGNGQVTEGGHGLGSVASTRPVAIFIVRDVTDVVQRFDAPVPTKEAQNLPLSRTVRSQARQAEDDFVTLLATPQHGGTLDTKALGGIGKAEASDARRQLDRPCFDPAMTLFTLGVPGGKAPSLGRRAAGASSSGCL